MKKLLIVVMTVFCALVFTGCAKKEEPVISAGEENTEVVGGWNVAESSAASFDDEIQAVFDGAMEGLTGAQFKPVALLGTQVVSGMNYAFLCEETTVTNPPVTSYAVVYIYRDLTGNSTISAVKEIEISSETSASDSELVGGWNITDDTFANPDESDLQLLDKAQEKYVGMSFELISCVASQLVSGTNHLMVCKGTTVTAEPVSRLVLVTVYENLQSEAEITGVSDLVLSVGE